MNIFKIQKLSEQHQALKSFHKTCNCTNVELRIHDCTSQAQFDDVLDSDTTALIIIEVRHILLKRIGDIEKDIRKEATGV